mmetsp:Transcript_4152/g.11757  ORF Transcript_4152/g.11757 Transcript_4152/m.11757 type:complete len:206 (-) Transcript_4152:585-1202(-)
MGTQDTEDETAAAAQQLGSLSLGESAERKDDNNDNKPNTKSEAPTKFCSACGKKSDALKQCMACKCVWYCDKECQKNTARSIRRSANASRRNWTKEEASSISAVSWMLALSGKCPRETSVPSACAYCPFTQGYKSTMTAAARLSARAASISTIPIYVHFAESRWRNPTRRHWPGYARESIARIQGQCSRWQAFMALGRLLIHMVY